MGESGTMEVCMKKSIIIIMVVSALTLAFTGCGKKDSSSEATKIEEGKSLNIPIKDLSGKAKFYSIEVDGTEMEIFAAKDADGTIKTAFNTCQVCYDSGKGYYKQEGDKLVCQNCGNSFTLDQVGTIGSGCNPWPILEKNETITDDEIQIPYDFLKDATSIFANWKEM